jgi:two-component system phosphate regulon response regulator PhoB
MNSVRKPILLVEDDFSIRETLKYVLESESYVVQTANNGQEGLDFLRATDLPHLVLLDFLMPVMGGAEFLRQLRADPKLFPTVVVIVSATVNELGAHKATALVKKPIDLDQLLGVVAKFSV